MRAAPLLGPRVRSPPEQRATVVGRTRSARREDAISDPVRYPERERRFLGCVRIPLSAVYQMQYIEGTFKLEVRAREEKRPLLPRASSGTRDLSLRARCAPHPQTPPVVLGYTQRSERPPCVSLVLSLNPRLAAPPEAPEHLLSGEMEDINRYARA